VRVENLKTPEDYVPEVLARVKRHHLTQTYGVDAWDDAVDFLAQIAKKGGRLLKVCACGFLSLSLCEVLGIRAQGGAGEMGGQH
jgi:hypothetical protein